jgi:type I restriction enzyme M protein
MTADVKGDAYEGLLEKNAQVFKTAAQYLTLRVLILAPTNLFPPFHGLVE